MPYPYYPYYLSPYYPSRYAHSNSDITILTPITTLTPMRALSADPEWKQISLNQGFEGREWRLKLPQKMLFADPESNSRSEGREWKQKWQPIMYWEDQELRQNWQPPDLRMKTIWGESESRQMWAGSFPDIDLNSPFSLKSYNCLLSFSFNS